MTRLLVPVFALTLLASSGCAHATRPPSVRIAARDLAEGRGPGVAPGTPIILEFMPGDRVPIELVVESNHFALDPASPELALVATAHFFVRIDGAEIAVSDDGVDFERLAATPGTFRLGVSITRERGTRIEAHVRAPGFVEPAGHPGGAPGT